MQLVFVAPALIMIGLSAIMVVSTGPMGLWSGFTPGPAFFPFIIAGFATTISVILLLGYRRSRPEAVIWPDRGVMRIISLVYLSLVGFVVLAPILGILVTAVAFLTFVMLVAFRQPVVGSLIATCVTTGFIYVIFVRWLQLPMPKGIFGF